MSYIKPSMSKTIPLRPIPTSDSTLVESDVRGKQNALLKEAFETLERAKQERESLLKQTREEIQSQREQFELELKELEQTKLTEAQEQGYQKGYQMGQEQAQNEVWEQAIQYLTKCENLWLETQSEVSRYLEGLNPALIEIIRYGTERLIHQTVKMSDVEIQPLIEPLWSEIKYRKRLTITFHPKHLEEWGMIKEELLKVNPSIRLEVRALSEMLVTDCIVETEHEKIDLTLETRLENLVTCLKEVMTTC